MPYPNAPSCFHSPQQLSAACGLHCNPHQQGLRSHALLAAELCAHISNVQPALTLLRFEQERFLWQRQPAQVVFRRLRCVPGSSAARRSPRTSAATDPAAPTWAGTCQRAAAQVAARVAAQGARDGSGTQQEIDCEAKCSAALMWHMRWPCAGGPAAVCKACLCWPSTLGLLTEGVTPKQIKSPVQVPCQDADR